MIDDPRGVTFEPRYHWLVRIGLALDTTLIAACVGTGLTYLALERFLSPDDEGEAA